MKKHILTLIPLLLLTSCNTSNSSSFVENSSSLESSSQSSLSISSEDVSSEVSSSEEITTSLIEMMAAYKTLSNYTYTVDDQIFNVITTHRYTRYAYYYEPSTEKHGGKPIGYAENSQGVFSYTIENDEVIYGEYLLDQYGNKQKNLWFNTILSFIDIELNLLPTTPVEGNKYKIEDDTNKLLISSIAGLGDLFLQQYLEVYIELLSNTTFRTIVYTAGLPDEYRGYAYGTFSDINSTTIEPIEDALDKDLGPKEISTALVDFLKKLKEGKNYTVTTSGYKAYKDRFSEHYFHSQQINSTNNYGYALSKSGVFRYEIVSGEIIPSEVIKNASNQPYSSIWSDLPNFHSLAGLNLSLLKYTEENNGYKVTESSILYTFANLCHINSFNMDNSNNYIFFTIVDEELHFEMNIDNGIVNGIISDIETTSIKEIEDYIAAGKGPLTYENLDKNFNDTIAELHAGHNYSLDIVSSVNNKNFTLNKKFTETAYYQESSIANNSYGYLEKGPSVYKFTYDENLNKIEESSASANTYLWLSNLFKGFNILTPSSINGKKISDNVYQIEDSTNKNAISEILGLGIYDLMFYSPVYTFTFNDDNSYTISIETKTYGSISGRIHSIGTTTI